MQASLPYRSLLVGITVLSFTLASAGQSMLHADPLERLVTYRIYANPDAASGPVDYEITLWLMEMQRIDNDILWAVKSVSVRTPGDSSGQEYDWEDLAPTVNTPSGYWQITHEDPDNPITEEFVLPPEITGTAVNADGVVSDLSYAMAGQAVEPPPSYPGTGATAMLDWQIYGMAAPPIGELPLFPPEPDGGDDEPAEVPPVIEPPGGN